MSRPSSSRALVTSRHSSAPDTHRLPAPDAVRLADSLDAEDGGRRLLDIARRLGRTEAADPLVEPGGAGVQ